MIASYVQAAHADIDTIFKMILPQYGMDVRERQVRLCHDLFDALAGKQIALCDAGVGIGKTIAYIVAAVMLDKHMPKDDTLMQYYDSIAPARLPFLISTSSIALQQAILSEHIPFLSETLQKHSMIEAPFSGQVQKGKENYVCRARLRRRLAEIEHSHKSEQQMDALIALKTEKELDRVPGLSHFDRRRVRVPRKCYPDCPDRELCSYQRYIQETKKKPHLFQVCNHHYFLADAIHHEKGYASLLPYFRAVIVDEAHQLYPTVQSMCGSSVSRRDTAQLLGELCAVGLNSDANRLRSVLDALFDLFYGKVIFQYKKLLGYRKGEDGEPEIVEDEAKIIRRIFRSYLVGQSMRQIELSLIEDGIQPPGQSERWQRSHIKNILQNEKYMGDALLQKSYVVDCISKKTKKNNGELPQYYVKDNHPAIVSREMFNKVQEEIARRNSKVTPSAKSEIMNKGRFSCKYALTELMRCEECGAPYRRTTWTAREQKRIVWRCLSRLQSGKEVCKHSITIPEPELHALIMRGIRSMLDNSQEVFDDLNNTLLQIIRKNGSMSEVDYDVEIKSRQDTMMKLAVTAIEKELPEDYFDHKLLELSEEIATLEKQKARLAGDLEKQQRMQKIEESLMDATSDLTKYDDMLVKQEVESVLVRRNGRIQIKFRAGGEFEGEI